MGQSLILDGTSSIVISFPTILAGLIVAFIVYEIIYGLFYSPLRHLPGPTITKISVMPEMYNRMLGKHFSLYQKWHEQYGPIVRVAPNRVSVLDAEAVKEIYSGYIFTKGPMYQLFTPYGDNIFATGDREFHDKRKRLLKPTFSPKSVTAMEPLVWDRGVALLIEKLKNKIESNSENCKIGCNLYKEFHYLTFDIAGELVFSTSLDLIVNEKHPVLNWIRDITTFLVFNGLFGVGKLYDPKCKRELRNLVQTSMNKRRAETHHGGERSDILSNFMEAKDKETGIGMTDEEIISECVTMLIAGTDTTSNTLVWSFYMMLLHPEVYHKVQAEIDEIFADVSEITFEKCKQNLVYLEAVFQESMRMFPMGAAIMARSVPPGGKNLGGYYMPEGTEIGSSMLLYQRSAEYWSKPEKFDPERFLGEESKISRTKTLPFMVGPRACIGREVAWMEMYLTTVGLFKTFNMKLAEDFNPKDMEPECYMVLRPAGGNLQIEVSLRS